MSSGIHFSLDNLPERYKAQVARQLASGATRETVRRESPKAVVGRSGASCGESAKETSEKSVKRERRTAKPRRPNGTEARFNATHLDGKGAYEAVKFRVADGCHYTPDWIVWDSTGRMTAYEIKGAHALASENRARAVFLTCREKYPSVRFRWFVLKRSGVFEERFSEDESRWA